MISSRMGLILYPYLSRDDGRNLVQVTGGACQRVHHSQMPTLVLLTLVWCLSAEILALYNLQMIMEQNLQSTEVDTILHIHSND